MMRKLGEVITGVFLAVIGILIAVLVCALLVKGIRAVI